MLYLGVAERVAVIPATTIIKAVAFTNKLPSAGPFRFHEWNFSIYAPQLFALYSNRFDYTQVFPAHCRKAYQYP